MAASRPEQDPPGFTLLEILMVVALIATFAAIVGARIGGGFGIAIGGEGRVVAAELRHAAQRALATGRTQRWVVDLDAQTFRLEEEIEVRHVAEEVAQALRDLLKPPQSTRHFVPVQNQYGGWRRLDEESVRFDSIQTREGFFDQGLFAIGFGPDGGADLALVRLSDEHDHRLGVQVEAFTGAVRILDEKGLDELPVFFAPLPEDDAFDFDEAGEEELGPELVFEGEADAFE